jgi:hypothetical protein
MKTMTYRTACFEKCKQLFEHQHSSYLETTGGQSSVLYLNVHLLIFSTLELSVNYIWQLKTVVFMHWFLIRTVLL